MSKSIQKVIDLIQSYMAEDGLIWHKPFLTATQSNAASRKEYRGINHFVTALVAFREGYSSPYWATFKQIKEMDGALVDAKGKGVPIIFYKELPSDGRDVDSEKRRFVARHSFVFNLDLVEGIDLKLVPPERIDFDQHTGAEAIIHGYVTRESIHVSTGSPSYAPATDVVNMPPMGHFISQDEYYSAFFHELAHSTGHNRRLSRFDVDQVRYESKEEYSKEELVAEITAALLCHGCGVDSHASIKNSGAYLQGWSKFIQGSAQAFTSAVSQSYKARDLILDHGRTNE